MNTYEKTNHTVGVADDIENELKQYSDGLEDEISRAANTDIL